MSKLIITASLGNCIHRAGIYNFTAIAQKEGYKVIFLGPAVSVGEIVEATIESKPEIVALSYRLTPQNARCLLQELEKCIEKYNLDEPRYFLAGTDAVAQVAREFAFIDTVFSSSSGEKDVIAALHQDSSVECPATYPQKLMERIEKNQPYPILRHHFGLPDLQATVEGIKVLAQSGLLDVISIGPDQNTQEFYFEQGKMNDEFTGAGGVPLRREEDFDALYQASQCGNRPLLRCYSGTNNLLSMAELLQRTIKNAWAAIPIFWYSCLDGRSKRELPRAINENQKAIAWHGQRNIPVEVNESHQWSLRMAADAVAVVAAYLGAYNAKKLGVTQYVAQFMFNTPFGTTPTMDLGKMLAKIELINSLQDESFKVFRQVRAGLAGFPTGYEYAKGHLAASTYLSAVLKPDIVHVVAFCEAQHMAKPKDIIQSCQIVRQIYKSAFCDFPDATCDERVLKRKEDLVCEAKILLEQIAGLSDGEDPFTDSAVLTQAVQGGIMDAPQVNMRNNALLGITTRLVDGACVSYSEAEGRTISEEERIAMLTKAGNL